MLKLLHILETQLLKILTDQQMAHTLLLRCMLMVNKVFKASKELLVLLVLLEVRVSKVHLVLLDSPVVRAFKVSKVFKVYLVMQVRVVIQVAKV